MAKLWYTARIAPFSESFYTQATACLRKFIWNGRQSKVEWDVVILPKTQGSLSFLYFVKQTKDIFTQLMARRIFTGGRPQLNGPLTNSWAKRNCTPLIFSNSHNPSGFRKRYLRIGTKSYAAGLPSRARDPTRPLTAQSNLYLAYLLTTRQCISLSRYLRRLGRSCGRINSSLQATSLSAISRLAQQCRATILFCSRTLWLLASAGST
ncbi:hypothetical protein GGH92_001022 [Coemansia sp. RSA 2673]|nr:hypothetical protein GGH92_001022 [Coemansia sp. RSA 2673]